MRLIRGLVFIIGQVSFIISEKTKTLLVVI